MPTDIDYDSTTSETIWIDVPNGRLAAQDEGEGPPVLLVHSAVVNRRSWNGVVPRLVDAGYRVIRYDMRGFGESTAEEVEFQPHGDVVAVLDHFGVRQAALGGNSMGAAFSLDAVLESPERFVAYVWVGGGIGGFNKEPSASEDGLFTAEGEAEDAKDWDLAAELDTRIWMDGWRDGVNEPSTRVDPAVRASMKAMDRELLEPGRVYGEFKRPDPPAIDRLETVAVPTLVVIGDLDTTGTRASAEILAERVAGARIVRMPEVAHIIGMEQPEKLASLIVEHLAPLPRWS
ncbi:MAG TPA: alpha/beta hydrolase [Candidatus Limnocylindrales bacterium]|jgi:pimeloyl-ACP methyl ester carboxylesterase|nr:alpha/beta hydrolase [Candidatus Limnocylindrales bacterium]